MMNVLGPVILVLGLDAQAAASSLVDVCAKFQERVTA